MSSFSGLGRTGQALQQYQQQSQPGQQGQEQQQGQGLIGQMTGQQGRIPMSAMLEQLQGQQQRLSQIEERYGIQHQSAAETAMGAGVPPLEAARQGGAEGVSQLGQQLAERYGVAGRAPLIDQAGNFTREPAGADEAAKFQYIALALANFQAQQKEQQAQAARAAGIGLVQQRGRGSLATLTSGGYESLAGGYERQVERVTSMQPDFSYYIEKEMLERQEAIVEKQLKMQKKQGKYGFIGGILGAGIGLLAGGPAGMGAGFQMGQNLGAGAAYW